VALTRGRHLRGIAIAALAVSACALGPAASAEASSSPLDQVTATALGAAGQVASQVDGPVNEVNATLAQAGTAVDGARRGTDGGLQSTASGTRQSVETATRGPGREVAGVAATTTRGAARTVAAVGQPLSADSGSAAAASIREKSAPSRGARQLRMTSRRPEGVATSARAGLGTDVARGPAAPASVAPDGSAGAERQDPAAASRVFPGIPGLGLGIDNGGFATGATALLLLSAFALALMMGGTVPPALRSRLSVATGIRRSPPLILVLERPG
jgi:hypothetical protein